MKTYKQKEQERRRQRIYRIATKTLWEKGYDKTTIRDIARATEMTTAGLYYYFKSKEELLFQILNAHMNNMLAGIEKIEDTGDPLDLIEKYINYQVHTFCNDKYQEKLLLNDDDCLSGQWYKQVKDKQRKYLSFWRNALKKYCEKKGCSTKDVSLDAHFLVGMCAWIYRWYDPKGDVNPDALASKIFRTYVFGLESRGSV